MVIAEAFIVINSIVIHFNERVLRIFNDEMRERVHFINAICVDCNCEGIKINYRHLLLCFFANFTLDLT